MTRALYLIFFFSGFAGLIYEGTWARYLKMFLGHSSYGQILTICIYMGGLGIGSFWASKLSSRFKNMFVAYAVIEILIAIYGFGYHSIFLGVTEWFYDSTFTQNLSSSSIDMLKIGLSILITMPPAILLGMTFPFMANGLIRLHGDSGRSSLSMLYFTNSLGAAIGILITSYFLIAKLGTYGALSIAATLNLLIAGVVYLITYVRSEMEEGEVIEVVEEEPEMLVDPSGDHDNSLKGSNISTPVDDQEDEIPSYSFDTTLWLFIAFGTGLTSFIYEVDWMRMLSLMMGASTHSFDIMLSAFIIGISLGSLTIKKILQKRTDLPVLLGYAQLFMGIAALMTIYFYKYFFEWMNASNHMFARTDGGYQLWTFFKFLLSVLWMAPTSFFAGMTLPLITFYLVRRNKSEKYTGQVYGWNTIGSITGAAVGGLVMLPLLQLKWTLASAAISDILTGLVLLWLYKVKFRRAIAAPIAIAMIILPLFFMDYHKAVLTSGVFRGHQKILEDTDTVTVRSGRTATISFHSNKVQKYIKTNGKVDASITRDKSKPLADDQRTQAATAFIPMATRNQPYDAAVVGFGSGMTVHYLLSDPLLKSMDMVEIEEEMIHLAEGFRPDNERGYSDPRINMVVDDARTYFHTAQKSYDMIVSVPSNPWVSGVSSLFSTEFYHHIKRFMNEGGVLVQWLQLYEFDTGMFLPILKALQQNFKDVIIYQVPEEPDVIILAADYELSQEYLPRFLESDSIMHDFNVMQRPHDYFGEGTYLTRLSNLNLLLERIPPNSDFRPIVDHGAEATRFKRAEVDLFETLVKTNLSWQHLLGEADLHYRHDAVTANLPKLEAQQYKEEAMRLTLESRDSLKSEIWEDLYFDWEKVMNAHPLDAGRDSLPIYAMMQDAVMRELVPAGPTALFLFWDALKTRNWENAFMMLDPIMESYELASMRPETLRAMAITLHKVRNTFEGIDEVNKEFFREAVLFNEEMKLTEKILIKKVLRM